MTSPIESQNPNNASQENLSEPRPKVSFWVKAFGSGLFSGYSPVASGTVGSAVGLAIYFLPNFEHPYVIMPACFLVLLLGIKAADLMEAAYGHDPAEVTIDEVLGMWISLLFLPKSLLVAIGGFFVFRILDIVKPFPAKKFDNARGGVGIMFDDVISGFYTNLILHVLVAFHILN